MPQFIKNDTTWSGVVTLSDDVRVGPNATLTVAAGTEILGNGYSIDIEGHLFIEGEADATVLLEDTFVHSINGDWSHASSINVSHAEFSGGAFMNPNGVARYTTIDVDNTIFNSTEYYTEIWYPLGGSIERSIFIDNPGVSIGVRFDSEGSFSFSDNVVDGQRGSPWHEYAIEVWASYEQPFQSSGNAFLSEERVAILVQNYTDMVSTGDYFAGNLDTAIADSNNGQGFGNVEVVDQAETVPADLARPLHVWTSTRLPSIFETATLLGERSASLTGNALDNRLTGNAGNNLLVGDRADDFLRGEAGNDTIDAGAGDDRVMGGDGNDSVKGGGGNDFVRGEDGDDTLKGDGGNDHLRGGEGDDRMIGGSGDDNLRGDNGNDTLYGGAGSDRLYGLNDDDWMNGGAGDDTVVGNSGNDTIYGGPGDDWINGVGGNDEVYGGNGNDRMYGAAGNHTLDGGRGDDTIDGGTGSDIVEGGLGDDLLLGDKGGDRLLGGAGDDTLDGGIGNDILSGGEGFDTFVFEAGSGRDRIIDFGAGDVLDFSNAGLVAADLLLETRGSDVLASFDGADATVLFKDGAGLVSADDFLFA